MKLVGINGKSFSGKTTFANLLGEHEDVGVIHVDDIMDKIKQLFIFKKLLSQKDDVGPKRMNSKLVKTINSSKILFESYMKLKAIFVHFFIKRQIQQLKNNGKQIIVIESVFLNKLFYWDKFNTKILIGRRRFLRQEGAKKREDCEGEEFYYINLPYKNGVYNLKELGYDIIVENNYTTIEELKKEAEKIYIKLTGEESDTLIQEDGLACYCVDRSKISSKILPNRRRWK